MTGGDKRRRSGEVSLLYIGNFSACLRNVFEIIEEIRKITRGLFESPERFFAHGLASSTYPISIVLCITLKSALCHLKSPSDPYNPLCHLLYRLMID